MKAIELYQLLRDMESGWVDWGNTVDTFKAGDPQTEISAIAVGWMGYTWALEKAAALGCNVFVTHEPTYYNHWDTDEDVFRFDKVRAKRQMIEDKGLVVMRCHDVWDQVEDIGIPDSWAQMIGLKKRVAGDGYYRVYDVTGHTARSMAEQVARNTRSLGQSAVQLVGPAEQAVTRVAIGTGAITPFAHLMETYGVDLAICSDDGFTYWRDGAMAIDMGLPVIIVNHPVSEIHGIKQLHTHLDQTLADMDVHWIEQACMYELITG